MSISLIKKQDNSKENQKQYQKLLLSKRNYYVSITDFEYDKNENDNILKTGIAYVYLTYSKNYYGFKFLKATLKKLLKLENITFKDFSKQEIQEIIDTPTRILLQE